MGASSDSNLVARDEHSVLDQQGKLLRKPRRGRILVVDDDPLVRRAVQRSLASEHDVSAVASGSEVLARIAAGERFDVIVCDLLMPSMTGMDLYEELSTISTELAQRMVFLTGGAFTPRAIEFLERVPNQRLEKPFNALDLRALLRARIG
jgi:CheY-like chemotaxis protein